MNTIIDFVTTYWTSITIFITAVIYILTHQKIAIEYAKNTALSIMFSIEANAEQYILTEGFEKLQFVCENGYSSLPYLVRIFVTEEQFRDIVQDTFDKARAYAEAHKQV